MPGDPHDPPRVATPVVDEHVVIIAHNSDVVIHVMSEKNHRSERSLTKFLVNKAAIAQNSEYFAASLRFNQANGGRPILLKNDHVTAMHIWLAALHDNDDDQLWSRDVVCNAGITTVWHLINACDKYLFNGELLRGFFKRWYAKNVDIDELASNSEFARQLVLPCHFFDHAEGFARVTEWLVYNIEGHISESKPVMFRWKHLHLCPPDFVGPVNHARGNLKSCIHRGIWREVGRMLQQGENQDVCTHWAKTAGYYFAALTKTGAYPLEKSFPRNSVNSLLGDLRRFNMTYIGGCDFCTKDWEEEVSEARRKTSTHFQGLCLDCMDRSKIVNERSDANYWTHLGFKDGGWDSDCRVKHGEATWYVSWCGRGEHRQKLLATHRGQSGN